MGSAYLYFFLSFNHARTTEPISMKLCTKTAYISERAILYLFSFRYISPFQDVVATSSYFAALMLYDIIHISRNQTPIVLILKLKVLTRNFSEKLAKFNTF